MNYSQNIANTMIYCRDFYFNNLINVVLQAPLPLKLYYKIVTHVLPDIARKLSESIVCRHYNGIVLTLI
jgi:hypothetical protein